MTVTLGPLGPSFNTLGLRLPPRQRAELPPWGRLLPCVRRRPTVIGTDSGNPAASSPFISQGSKFRQEVK